MKLFGIKHPEYILAFSLSLVFWVTGSQCAAIDQGSKSRFNLQPINLFRDDTDRKIKSIKVAPVPRSRPEKTFEPQSRLTLEETLSIVDTHYPKLLQGHVEVSKAEGKTLEAQGAFDPVLKNINEYKRIQDITKSGVFKNAVHNESRLELPTRSGIRLFAEVRVNPNDASSPVLQSGRSGEYSGGAIVPLMRNFIVNPERGKEQQARLGQSIAAINLNISRMNVLFEASVAYWDWINAYQKFEVAKGLLDIAVSREDFVKKQVADGDMPALDITEAEKEIRIRRGNLVRAERDIARAAFKLSLFLWSNRGDKPPDISEVNLVKADLTPRTLSDAEVEAGIQKALSVRPELASIDIQREIVNVDLKVAKNMMLPVVDLIYRQGYDTGVDGIGNVFTGGIKMTVPVRQRKARGLIQQAKMELRKLELEEQFLKRKISIEVRDAASELNAAFERFIQAGEEVEKARAVEEGERKRYGLGDSSLFLVNRRERDRAEAEEKRIIVYGLYLKALAAFNTITGDI
ncbi:MAG: TolC family protein [Cyanobacteria bacterium HKST-UBA01]|nr:TolC family protein [Cyanobacteria bacterium HKST-UBA01]